MTLSHRLSEPTPVRDRRSWRLGRFELEHKDIGRPFWSSWQLNIGSRYRVVECSSLKFALSLNHFHDNRHVSLDFFGVWVVVPFFRTTRHEDDMMSAWGFSTCEDTLQLRWGKRCKILYAPWSFQHIDPAHQALMADETWVTFPRTRYVEGQKYVGPDEALAAIGPRWQASYPYRYMRRSGDVQERTATVTVERRAWRRKFLPAWLPLWQKRSTCIDIKFSDEVGERTGSWKGGTVGCSYEMKPGERPGDTLKRMEQERRFT